MPISAPLVLVVDDEPAIREILAEVLTDEGYDVSLAKDGREALDHTVLESPDLILSDIVMPRMHGITMAERVRDDGHDMPIILMSSSEPDVVLPGVRVVHKPVDLDEVVEAVAEELRAAATIAAERAIAPPGSHPSSSGARGRPSWSHPL